MAEFQVKICILDEVSPHPNADRLDIARIGGWQIVVGKGDRKAGDLAAYIPEQALVPEAVQKALGVEGRLAGSKKNRVKAVRLRGVLSQGLVLPLEGGALTHPETGEKKSFSVGDDASEFLGITKYEPPIPVSMEGEAYPAPLRLPNYDVENWKSDPTAITPGTRVLITEKLHGTLCLIVFFKDETIISSKGLSAKNMGLKENEKNVYHRIAGPHLPALKQFLIARRPTAFAVGAVGEIVGRKVQDLQYGHQQPQLYLFDAIWKKDEASPWDYEDFSETEAIAAEAGLPSVPVLGETKSPGPDEISRAEALADGKTAVPGADHIREGVVLRTLQEWRNKKGDRCVRKIVSGAYLTRKGGTERR